MEKLVSVLWFALCICSGFAAEPASVLFIGNSFTYVNDLPNMVKELATANGKTLYVEKAVRGGLSINQHSKRKETLDALASRKWDVVILQGQSVEPLFNKKTMIEGGKLLADKCGNARLAVFMTWAYQTKTCFLSSTKWALDNGYTQEALQTMYSNMQKLLSDGYIDLAKAINADVAPVGLAWEKAREKHPEWNLFKKDNKHPSMQGSYLAAIVFYKTLYGVLPEKPAKKFFDKKVHNDMKEIVEGLSFKGYSIHK